ncbi:MAG: hypothetical protein ABL888_16320 [Pirellulaceae bacterium]
MSKEFIERAFSHFCGLVGSDAFRKLDELTPVLTVLRKAWLEETQTVFPLSIAEFRSIESWSENGEDFNTPIGGKWLHYLSIQNQKFLRHPEHETRFSDEQFMRDILRDQIKDFWPIGVLATRSLDYRSPDFRGGGWAQGYVVAIANNFDVGNRWLTSFRKWDNTQKLLKFQFDRLRNYFTAYSLKLSAYPFDKNEIVPPPNKKAAPLFGAREMDILLKPANITFQTLKKDYRKGMPKNIPSSGRQHVFDYGELVNWIVGHKPELQNYLPSDWEHAILIISQSVRAEGQSN